MAQRVRGLHNRTALIESTHLCYTLFNFTDHPVGSRPIKRYPGVDPRILTRPGIYGCDPARVLSVLARACIKREHLTENDAAWALKSALPNFPKMMASTPEKNTKKRSGG